MHAYADRLGIVNRDLYFPRNRPGGKVNIYVHSSVSYMCLAWWRCGLAVGLATPKVAGSTPGLALSGNNLGQAV